MYKNISMHIKISNYQINWEATNSFEHIPHWQFNLESWLYVGIKWNNPKSRIIFCIVPIANQIKNSEWYKLCFTVDPSGSELTTKMLSRTLEGFVCSVGISKECILSLRYSPF